MDVKDILNIGFGLLNPIRDTLVGKNFDPSNVRALDAVIKSTENSYAENASLGSGPYIGICLRNDGYLNERTVDPTNWATVSNEVIRKNNQSEAPKLLQIRVRIPELHSSLPIPQTLPKFTEESPDHGIVNMYPIFLAKDLAISSDVPQEGDMVWVDFQNSNTLEGPIYLGRVTNDTLINGNNTTSGRNSFAITCTQVPAVLPPQSQPINAAAGPPLPSFAANSAYAAQPKTPPQQNTVTVCGPAGSILDANAGFGGNPKDWAATGKADYAKADIRFLGFLTGVGNTGNRKLEIDFMVIHDGGQMAGFTAERTLKFWSKKTASSHYYIDLDGTVFQLEEEAKVTYHGGGGPIPNANGRSIGIDLQRCRPPGDKHKFKDKNGKQYNCGERGYRAPYSKEQMASLKDLLNDISKRRGIPYDENHIVAHGSLYQGNHADPVVGFEWSEIGLTNKYGPSPKGKFTQIPNPSSVSNKIA